MRQGSISGAIEGDTRTSDLEPLNLKGDARTLDPKP